MSQITKNLQLRISSIWVILILISTLLFGILILRFMPNLVPLVIGGILGICLVLFVLKRNWLVFYFFALLVPIEVGIHVPQLAGATITAQALIGIGLLLLFAFWLLNTTKIPKIPLLGVWLFYIVFSIFGYLLNSPLITGPAQGVWFIFRVVLASSLIYPAFWFFVPRQQSYIQKIFILIAFSATIFGIVGLLQTITGGRYLSGMLTNGRFLGMLFSFPPEALQEDISVLRANLYTNDIFRAHGGFYRTNGFGAFISIVLGLTWGLVRGSSGKKRLVLTAMFLIQCLAVIASFSRSAWLAAITSLAGAVILEIFITRGKAGIIRSLKLISLVLITGLIILAIGLQFEVVSARFNTLFNISEVPQVTWRIDIWKEALMRIMASPWFGTGQDTVVYLPVGGGEQGFGSHNLIIGIAYRQGLLILGCFLLFVIQLFVSGFAWFRSTNDRKDQMLALGVLSGAVAFLVAGIGGAIMSIDNISSLFWLLAATALRSKQGMTTSQFQGNSKK